MKTYTTILTTLAIAFMPLLGADINPTALAQLNEIRALLKPAPSDTQAIKTMKASLNRYPDVWQSMLENGQFIQIPDPQMMNSDINTIPNLVPKFENFIQTAKAENERKENAKIVEAQALLARVTETIKTAKKAEDLDALMLALSKTKINDYENNRRLVQVARELQSAMQIASNWQDYLLADESGDARDRRSHLEQIASQLSTNPIIPRSTVLRLIENPPNTSVNTNTNTKEISNASKPEKVKIPIEAIQTKLADTGDSAAALAELKAYPQNPQSSSEDYFLRALQAVEDIRKLESSMAESEVFANLRILQNNQQSNQGRYSLNRAIDQIALNAIARNYGTAIQSAKTISARKLLETMAVAASKAQDWTMLRKVITSIENLGTSPTSYSQENQKRTLDLKTISLLELGDAAEKRNDIETAAAAYLEAAAIDGQFIQRGTAYERLAALKTKSPDKIASILAKAEETKRKNEAARYAEMETRSQMMMSRGMMGGDRPSTSSLKPLVEEVVAEFLKGKRLETIQPGKIENKDSGNKPTR